MIYKTYKNLPSHLRKKIPLIIIFLLTVSVLDILGIGILLPLFKLLLDGQFLKSLPLINALEKDKAIAILCSIILFLYIIKNLIAVYIERYKTKFVYELFENYSVRILKSYTQKGLFWFNSIDSTILFKNIYLVPFYYATNIVFAFLSLLTESFIVSILIFGLIYTNASVFFLLLIIMLPFLLIYFKVSKKRTKEIGDKIDNIGPKVHQSVNDIIFGFLDIEIYQKETFFMKRYNNLINKFSDLNLKKQMFLIYPSRLIDTVVVVSLVSIVLWGLNSELNSNAILTTLITFGLVAMRSVPSINKISAAIVSIRSNAYTIDIVNKELEDSELIPNSKELSKELSMNPLSFNKSIAISDLYFKYPDTNKFILNGLNLEILKGTTIGIIGESGSGKTTLISIIAQLNRQTSGEILIDGTILKSEDKPRWQKNIGYVSQHVFIMNGTLKENIVFGEENVNAELLSKCLEGASLSTMVEQHPDKENMLLKENGGNLSGGQKQRVGIARALYSKANLFIFDEATSALDTNTEKEVMESIRLLSDAGYTIIIIAHRISTLINCDRIIKIVNGKVEGEYTYLDLIK